MANGTEQVLFKRYSTYPSPSEEEKNVLLNLTLTASMSILVAERNQSLIYIFWYSCFQQIMD